MEFFDKKQEVLEVKLTPYGRYKLSQGRLKPTYYSFFDEGVLYNSRYSAEGDLRGLLPSGVQVSEAGFVEKQNEIESRIQDKTAMLKTLNVYSGIQTTLGQRAAIIQDRLANADNSLLGDPLYGDPGAIYAGEELQPIAPRIDFLTRPLGKSKISVDKQPCWHISALGQEFSSSTSTLVRTRTQPYTPPDVPTTYQEVQNIPQIDISFKYDTYVQKLEPSVAAYYADAGGTNDVYVQDTVFTTPTKAETLKAITTSIINNVYINVAHKALVLEINEENVDFNKENFEIEVFLSGAAHGTSDNGYLEQLRFSLDPDTLFDQDHVEYYLTINSDEEINTQIMKNLGASMAGMLDRETGALSTRQYFIKDLYGPAEELCED
jgi:hypothetical protein